MENWIQHWNITISCDVCDLPQKLVIPGTKWNSSIQPQFQHQPTITFTKRFSRDRFPPSGIQPSFSSLIAMSIWLRAVQMSFTRNLGIKAAEADCKCLKCWDRISIIHCKQILPNFSKLEYDLIMFWSSRSIFWGSHQLKVFNRSNCHPPMKVQAPTLQLLVPPGSLVF